MRMKNARGERKGEENAFEEKEFGFSVVSERVHIAPR